MIETLAYRCFDRMINSFKDSLIEPHAGREACPYFGTQLLRRYGVTTYADPQYREPDAIGCYGT